MSCARQVWRPSLQERSLHHVRTRARHGSSCRRTTSSGFWLETTVKEALNVSRQVPAHTVLFAVTEAKPKRCLVWLPCSATVALILAEFSWRSHPSRTVQKNLAGGHHGQQRAPARKQCVCLRAQVATRQASWLTCGGNGGSGSVLKWRQIRLWLTESSAPMWPMV